MAAPIRVLIVDDSALMCHRLTTLIGAAPGFAVAGSARSGAECLAMVGDLHPDVITLDVEMPDMDGLATLRAIMARFPTPVLMVSAMTEAGARTTLDALNLGAVDYLTKPSMPWRRAENSFGADLIAKLIIAAQARVRRAARLYASVQVTSPAPTPARKAWIPGRDTGTALIVIGSSTGGPQALDRIFSEMQDTLPASILIVQHMPPLFTRSLAMRLGRLTPMPVREVVEDDALVQGAVLVAPGGYHVTLGQDRRLHLDQTEPVHGVRPAVDRLLLSLAATWRGPCLVIILTGMGTDGAVGARALYARGAEILAQDESTSIVYGMPRAVAEAGLAKAVLPLDDMSAAIKQWTQSAFLAALKPA